MLTAVLTGVPRALVLVVTIDGSVDALLIDGVGVAAVDGAHVAVVASAAALSVTPADGASIDLVTRETDGGGGIEATSGCVSLAVEHVEGVGAVDRQAE